MMTYPKAIMIILMKKLLIDKKIDVLQQQIVKHNKKLEQLQHQYIAKGGEAVEKYQETYQKREQLKIKHNAVESDLYDLVASELPLLLVRDLITDIKLQANDEHDDMIMRQAILQLDSLYKEFIDSYSGNISAGAEFVKFVKQQANESEKSIYTLSDQALFQINHLVESGFIEAKSEAKTILSSIESLTKHISEIDSYLSLDINEHELKEIYQMIKEIEQTIINKKVKLNELTNLRSEVNSKVMTTTSEFSKYVESYLTNVELNDSRERIIKYSNMALEILEKYSFQLQRRKTDILANTITNCYIKLANKKNLIHKIIMDSETLDLQYLSEEGSVVPKDSLSAGEKQLMVIAILWSLAICSKRKLPVIIDTPLSRLDSYHRTSLIKTYFPNAGEQTIILSTDSEINQSYYDLMKENVGDEFTLYYNEQTQSTTIQNGYWIGEEL